ncbi:MAG: mechanosensitive ion channel family protein [Pseudomonadota bacterium]
MQFIETLGTDTLQLLLILGIATLGHFLALRALKRAERIASLTTNIWDDSLINAAKKPLPALIWLIAAAVSLRLFDLPLSPHAIELLGHARNISIILCAAWFLFSLTREVADNSIAAQTAAGKTVDLGTIGALCKLSRIIIVVVALLTIMQSLGFSISGILAFGGVGGIAVGFAAKDLLANLIGGLMIHFDRPFSIGDAVRSPDRQFEGRVEDIGWRQTTIRSINMTLFYVPNSLFSTIVVENPSRMSHRRIREVIGLRYDDLGKMGIITEEVKTMLAQHPKIDQQQPIVVAFDQFADSSLNFILQAFTDATDLPGFQTVKQDILMKVADIIAKHGAEIAFPTRTLHIQQPA